MGAGVGLLDQHDARIAPGVTSDQCARAIARAVVDDDEFKIGQRLAEHAVDRLADESLVVV